MKIEQIQLSDKYDEALALLESLRNDEDVYVAYWPPHWCIEKFGVCPAPHLRPFAEIWNTAVVQGYSDRTANNLMYGRSALVRVE